MAHELSLNLLPITAAACRRPPGLCQHTVCRFNLTSERRDNMRQMQLGELAKLWLHRSGNEGRDRGRAVGMRLRPRIAA
jgi:hypothetical protein